MGVLLLRVIYLFYWSVSYFIADQPFRLYIPILLNGNIDAISATALA